MSRKPKDQDEFAGLDPTEAAELREVADLLKADQPTPEDEHFFQKFHQQIMTEVAVTPIPGRGDDSDPFLKRLVTGMFSGRLRPAIATACAVAMVAGAIWLVGRDTGTPPENKPEDVIQVAQELEAPLTVPEELWEDGFLANRFDDELAVADDSWLSGDDYYFDDYDDYDEAYEDDYYLGSYTFGEGSSWGLDDLTDEELLALEGMFEG